MNNKERALNILNYRDVDRLPAVHFGYWHELLLEWAEQGKIPKELSTHWGDGNAIDLELDKLIGWDFNWIHTYSPNRKLYPKFEYKVLETLSNGMQRVQNNDGLIERIYPGARSIPL